MLRVRNQFPFIPLMCVLAIAAIWPVLALGDTPRDYAENHEPYTFQGMRVRSDIVLLPGTVDEVSMGPALFQEIPPCKFISTLEADAYPEPWGGPAFTLYDIRKYEVSGWMQNGAFINPCSNHIPGEAIAVSARVFIFNATAEGTVWGSPAQ
jgi:hypothetical protein